MRTKSTLPILYIGRFQPFHLGHLDAVKQCFDFADSVIIGIGSSQYQNQPDNPFSAQLRTEMIKRSLEEAKIAPDLVTIILIPDIQNDEKWVSHVEKLAPGFGPVMTGSAHVQKLFKPVHSVHPIITPKFNLKISGTEVRRRMRTHEEWRNLVPNAVKKLWK